MDLAKAATYHKLAADHDVAPAQCHYGERLEHGHGVPVDLREAAIYFELAADQTLAPLNPTMLCVFNNVLVLSSI
jgi:TPR repeat protein